MKKDESFHLPPVNGITPLTPSLCQTFFPLIFV